MRKSSYDSVFLYKDDNVGVNDEPDKCSDLSDFLPTKHIVSTAVEHNMRNWSANSLFIYLWKICKKYLFILIKILLKHLRILTQ